jgi:hypothetical protein
VRDPLGHGNMIPSRPPDTQEMKRGCSATREKNTVQSCDRKKKGSDREKDKA